MNKVQLTTTAGLNGLTLSLTKFFSFFDDYTLFQFVDALCVIPVDSLGTTLCGIIGSIFAILYNEDKDTVSEQYHLNPVSDYDTDTIMPDVHPPKKE